MELICFSLIFLLALFLLYRAKLLRRDLESAVVGLLLFFAFLLRYAVLERITGDYTSFLYPWVTFFRENGGLAGLGQPLGNYNIPYLVFLSLCSYVNCNPLYLIKAFSVLFDVILAWSCLQIAARFTESRLRRTAVFLGVLYLPTVFLNGAFWGQCDSVYSALAVLSFYCALSGKPCRCMAAAAAAFAFKLQAVFLLPIFFVFLFLKKIKIRHLFVFPAVYVAMILPAVIAGRPFWETLLFYVSNATSAGDGLNYNSSSMYAFPFWEGDPAQLAKVGILAAFLLVLAVYILLFLRRKQVTEAVLLEAALVFAIGIPFFLPHMHDRYFFLADVLSFLYAMVFLSRFPIPFFVTWASLLGYHAYLRLQYFLPMWYGSTALLLALVWVLGSMVWRLCAGQSPGRHLPAETQKT